MKKEALEEMIASLEFSNKELEERKNECEDALSKAWYEGKIAANNEAIEVAKLLISFNKAKETTYYISFERQGSVMWVVKVNASSYEEAEAKALKAIHANDDISELTEEQAKETIDPEVGLFIIDENGNEVEAEEDATNNANQ